jgi:hypothetical protein
MKRALLGVALGVAIATVPGTATASSCPEAFHLHSLGDGDHEHGDHMHVGLNMEAVDQNENGLICVKHVTSDGSIHVHIDDRLP